MQGKNTHRLEENPLEAKFAEVWASERYNYVLSYMLSDRPNDPMPVSEHDQEVAATVIQWLGSPVGQCFLEDALGVEIRKQISKELLYAAI